MSTISFVFFCLVACVFLVLYIVEKAFKDDKKSILVSNITLLLSSYIFVFYADWRFAVVLALITVSTWFFAKHRYNYIGIIIVLISLAFFKYTNFFVESFSELLRKDYVTLNIILPLGISFFSFSAIGYIIDVRRGKIVDKDLLSVALYLSFFPKLTSGPIQRSDDFFKQISEKRHVGWRTFETGIQIFMFGLFKKIVLADRLSVFVNQVYSTPNAFGSITVFMAVIAYSLQIYFDFSGYSDMAIGTAKVLGFNLPQNFNLPYLSHNVTEFWKRWHITLSSWLQEYLYISFGGNRKGKCRTCLNLFLTMVIGGIWHGANWTYVVWGALHGLGLMVHKLWMVLFKSEKKAPTVLGKLMSIIVTFLFTSFCWIFFRAESISQAGIIIKRIFSFRPGLEQPYMWFFVALFVLSLSSVIAYIKSRKTERKLKRLNVSIVNGYYPLVVLSTLWGLVAFFVFCGLILCLAYTGGSPFIYGKY